MKFIKKLIIAAIVVLTVAAMSAVAFANDDASRRIGPFADRQAAAQGERGICRVTGEECEFFAAGECPGYGTGLNRANGSSRNLGRGNGRGIRQGACRR